MRRRGERRRRGIFRSLVFGDPYRKLVAIGLAIGLWFFLDNQISDNDEITLGLKSVAEDRPFTDVEPSHLQVQVKPVVWTVKGFENALTDQTITSVTLAFRGPKHLIERLRKEQPTFVARDSGEGDLEAQGGFEFSVAQIRAYPLDFDDLLQSMTPGRVKVVLEKNRRWSVDLTTDRLRFQLPRDVDEQRLLYRAAVFSSTDITLHGPEEDLPALQSAPKLFDVQLEKRPDEEVFGNLVLVDQFAHFSMEPPAVRVTIPLQPEPESYRLSVPIIVDDRALPRERQGRYRAEPDVEEITLRASGELRNILNSKSPERQQEWATENLRLWVKLPPLFGPGAEQKLPVQTPELLVLDPNPKIRPEDFDWNKRTVTIKELE